MHLTVFVAVQVSISMLARRPFVPLRVTTSDVMLNGVKHLLANQETLTCLHPVHAHRAGRAQGMPEGARCRLADEKNQIG